jgi:hypothetical protein
VFLILFENAGEFRLPNVYSVTMFIRYFHIVVFVILCDVSI